MVNQFFLPRKVKDIIVTLKDSGVPQDFLSILPSQWLSKPIAGGILIEPTNFCNYKCSFCPINRGLQRKKGYMSMETFKTIVDQIKGKKDYIYMNFAGEPTMNRNIWKFARYARDQGIKSMVSTNGSLLHTYTAEEILSSGLDRLLIAIDGASPETYINYRQSMSGKNYFLDVIDNVRKLAKAKSEWQGESPIIQVQFVVFKQNEHEVQAMKDLCADLGVDALALKSAAMTFGRQAGVQSDTASYQSEKYARKKGRRVWCSWLWQGVVLWNGDVTTCCYDYEGEHVVGNFLTDGGFWKVWHSERFNKMRKAVLKGTPRLCQQCELPNDDYAAERVFYKEAYGIKPNYEPPVKKEFLPIIQEHT